MSTFTELRKITPIITENIKRHKYIDCFYLFILLPSQPNANPKLVPQGTKAVHSIKLSLIKFIVLKLNRAIVWEKVISQLHYY
jgi:hypothetical protein